MNKETVVTHATARINNFKAALDWLRDAFETDEKYAQTFDELATKLSERRCQTKHGKKPAQGTQVHLCAIGKSGDVGRLLTSMFLSVGIRAAFLHPTEAMHGDLGSVFPGDLVLFISNRGESSELLELVPLLHSRQAETFVITAARESPLAQRCAQVLIMPKVREMCAHDHAPTTSTVVALALGQLLVAASMDDGSLDFESYAQNHPGGAIGKRIYLKVADVMVQGSQLPVVAPSAAFENCISVMTEKAMGTVFVVESGKLLGIITERDLRQAMKKYGPEIFARTAAEYMNQTPVTIRSDALAAQALGTMELRKTPLNFLPVVSECGEPVGLVRLHDLIKAGVRLG